MGETRHWYAPGHPEGEDRPLLIFPAAGWFIRDKLQGFAAPGYLVQHPGERWGSFPDKVAYFASRPDGRILYAWSEPFRRLTVADRVITIETERGHWVDVPQHMDDAGPVLGGYTIVEWQEPPVDVVEQKGWQAGDALTRTIAALEEIRGAAIAAAAARQAQARLRAEAGSEDGSSK